MDRCITDCGVVDVYVNYEDYVDEDGQNSVSDIGEKEEEETNAAIEEDKTEEKSDSDWEDEHENFSIEADLEHSSEEDGDEPNKTEYAVQEELQPKTGNVPS